MLVHTPNGCQTCTPTSSSFICRWTPHLCCSRWIRAWSRCSRYISFRSSMKCDVSLDKLEKAAQAAKNPVELQKDVMRQHWKSYTIRDTLWHVCDASGVCGRSCVRTSPLTWEASTSTRRFQKSASSQQGGSASTRSRETTWIRFWSRSARSWWWRRSKNWRNSSISWRRRWRWAASYGTTAEADDGDYSAGLLKVAELHGGDGPWLQTGWT